MSELSQVSLKVSQEARSKKRKKLKKLMD